MACGELGTSSARLTKALRMPLSLGEKVTEIAHVPWAAIAAVVHVCVSLQSFA
jgi:hypothetical protein